MKELELKYGCNPNQKPSKIYMADGSALPIKEAAAFPCSITIAKDGKAADAKRIFGVMGLGVKCGEEITVCTDGENEEAASAAIEAFLKANL